ncbi:MAG: type II toxin-antitoxin system RelE/ParE family toxin [Calditrichaceae bacterium]
MAKTKLKSGVKLLGAGNAVVIYSFINERGDDVPERYISDLSVQDELKIIKLIEFMLDRGHIFNKEKFRSLTGTNGIYEFKSDSHRLLCFILPGKSPKTFVLTHGFKKEKGKTPKKEIDKAEKIKDIVLRLYNNNRLKVFKQDEK